jgi:precorrin-2 methylase
MLKMDIVCFSSAVLLAGQVTRAMEGALLHYGDPLQYSTFDCVCIASAVIVPLFAL